MAATAAPGMAHVRSTSTAARAPSGARGRCFAPAGERLPETVAISGGSRAGARRVSIPAGLDGQAPRPSVEERQLLERSEVMEDDAPTVLPDQPVVLELPQDRVHLPQAPGGELRDCILGDAQRDDVPARVLHPEATCDLDQRRGDPRAEV